VIVTHDTRALTPTVTIVLSEDVRPLVPALTLAVARRSSAACRLMVSIDLAGRTDELERLFRTAVERVTALPARNAAHRAGYEIRDELYVPLVLALGAGRPDGDDIRSTLETLGILAADYFRGTRMDMHAVVLLPDVGERNDERYVRAYEQLAVLEQAVGEEAPRIDGRPLLRRRWIADCRTTSGAYAGDLLSVVPPLAEFLSTLTVGDSLRALEADVEGVLHGAHRERLTGYSAPGYAEIVFAPRVLVRYLACTAAAELFGAVLDRELVEADAPRLEDAVERCFAGMELATVRERLLPPPDAGLRGEERAIALHARQRARVRTREAALLQALADTRAWADESGADAACLLLAALQRPTNHSNAGPVRALVTLQALEMAAAEQVREVLDLTGMLERANGLEEEAAEMLRPPAEAVLEKARVDAADGPPEALDHSAATVARAAELRKEAAALRSRVAHLSSLLEPGGDLDALEGEVLAAGSAPLVETVAPPSMPAAAPAAPARRLVERLGGWLTRQRRGAAGLPLNAPVPAEATSGGSETGVRIDTAALVEWIRWLREFREDLQSLLGEVVVWTNELERTRQYYEREAIVVGRQLWTHHSFSHRLLSQRQCEELYAERKDGLLAAVERRGVLPLSRYLNITHTPLEPLQQPTNERFEGFDPAVDSASTEVLTDWLEKDVEDVLFGDVQVVARAHPVDRLRAMADSAEPLVRPQDPEVRPARVAAGLLPRTLEESRVPEASSTPVPPWIVTGDARRIGLRSALHGFAAHALAQLRPVRERFAAQDAPAPDEPLPRAALVEEQLDEFIVLALALGHIRREGDRLSIQGIPIVHDEAHLAQALRTTFGGRSVFARVGRTIGREVRIPETVTRLAALAGGDALPVGDRTVLARVVDGLRAGRWPSALPWDDEEDA
jgi:hypothetical protein